MCDNHAHHQMSASLPQISSPSLGGSGANGVSAAEHSHRRAAARPHTSECATHPAPRQTQQAQALLSSAQAQQLQQCPLTNGRQRGQRDGDGDGHAPAPRPRTMPSLDSQSLSASLPARISISSTLSTDVAVPPSPIDTRGTLANLLRSSSTAAAAATTTTPPNAMGWPAPARQCQHRRASSHNNNGVEPDRPRYQFNIFAHSRAAEQREQEIEALVRASRHRAQQVCLLTLSGQSLVIECWRVLRAVISH